MSDVPVSEAAIGHPDMCSACSRLQEDALFFRSERAPFQALGARFGS